MATKIQLSNKISIFLLTSQCISFKFERKINCKTIYQNRRNKQNARLDRLTTGNDQK